MGLLRWQEDFALGIGSVDMEHRRMIDLINACCEHLGGEPDAQEIERFLGEIHSGIAAHFALEEQFMASAGYPEFEAHKEDHEALLDQILDILEAFVEDPVAGREMLGQRLGEWFSRHFATFDARLHQHFPGQS